MGGEEGRRRPARLPDRQERREHRRSPRAALGRTDLIRVLAETDGWVAVDKPPGVVVIPAPTSVTSLWRALEGERGERLWAVHRIDRGTSGVVVFARDEDSHRALSMAFEHGDVRKTYLAFVRGVASNATIETSLHTARRGRVRPAMPGEAGSLGSRTEIRVRERWEPDASLVEARPLTGRHHQIRVHLKSIGAPLLVDPIYGGVPSGCCADLPPWRLTLHAHHLEFGDTTITSPLPDDLLALRECLTTTADSRRSPSG